MKNHKNVHKLQLKNKLESYRFFRLSPHENRSLVFYRLKCSGGEVTSRSGGIQRRSPQPPLFHKECVYRDLKSSQHRLKQKSSKKGLDIVRLRTHWSKKFLSGNRSVNIQALGLGLAFGLKCLFSVSLATKRLTVISPSFSFKLFTQQGRLS